MIKTYSITNDGKNKQLSPHFQLWEFACSGSDKVLVDTKLLKTLENVRAKFGGTINITSGYRTSKYNASIRGASNSAHLYGQAVDFKVFDKNGKAVSSKDVCCYLQDIWFDGSIGYIGTATHIDTRYKNLIDETVDGYYFLNIKAPGKNFRQYFKMPLYKIRMKKGSNVRTGCGITYRKTDYTKRGDYHMVYQVGKSSVGTTWAKIGTYRWVYKGNAERV